MKMSTDKMFDSLNEMNGQYEQGLDVKSIIAREVEKQVAELTKKFDKAFQQEEPEVTPDDNEVITEDDTDESEGLENAENEAHAGVLS